MDQRILYGKSGNSSYEVTKAWLKNHGIPCKNTSVYQITKEEIERLASIAPGGAKAIVYPDEFSFALINPQKAADDHFITRIQAGELPEEEIISLINQHPHLMITPILVDNDDVIIGYDYEKLVESMRFVKVKDVKMA
ncbi:ArsC/Spx/MgsR family protein [Alteribacillus sp. JSM 102045]|uniref:ArsC/Spx/MgsR family protein n=1 Tax=Alteribacillus sp. JSM 102045 TaxID=1562101 RepID=UPI0035BFBF70